MHYFRNGEKVEVLNKNAWFPATVLRSAPAARRKGEIYVEYDAVLEAPAEDFSSDGFETRSSKLRVFADLADVRPAQPPELHRFFKVGEMVEVLTEAAERGWRKGRVSAILENSKYLVAFSGNGGDGSEEVDHWGLRAIRAWVGGSWVPPFLHEIHSPELPRKHHGVCMRIKRTPFAKLIEGMSVEAIGLKKGVQKVVWYPATIIQPLRYEKFLVGYITLRTGENSQYVREEVGILDIRPSPPLIPLGAPVGFEQVDGWYNGGWWAGYVSRVVGGGKYVVCLRNTGEEIVFEHYKLRPHQDWDKGSWIQSSKITPNQAETSSKSLKRKIKFHGNVAPEEIFTTGMMVEIRTDEAGYIGSMFPAKIVNHIGNGEYVVEYQTIRTDDETQLLKEVISDTRIRPFPPAIEKGDYKVLEEVDAWYNDGWWAGLISGLAGPLKYAVYFWTSGEELTFGLDHLRPHQDWNRGKWTIAPTPKKLSPQMPKPRFSVGMMAEVKSHAYGFVGSWYTVKILSSLDKDKYIIEYETLRMEDESKLLQEAVDGYQIRPCPPPIEKIGCYRLLEVVDAWFNDGWWTGLISQVHGASQYTVYFWTTSEEMVCGPRDLRPHQDWTNGSWTTPCKMSNSLMRSQLGKSRGWDGPPAFFSNGASVEVCSKEEGSRDAWYPGVIIRPMGDGKYLVHYRTMTKDDDETELLIREADGACIRPSPPVFLQDEAFKPSEQVDAWYCEGWCVGHIRQVMADSNYMIYVNITNEVVEFQFANLRPHQDWFNPVWTSNTKGRTLVKEAEPSVP